MTVGVTTATITAKATMITIKVTPNLESKNLCNLFYYKLLYKLLYKFSEIFCYYFFSISFGTTSFNLFYEIGS